MNGSKNEAKSELVNNLDLGEVRAYIEKAGRGEAAVKEGLSLKLVWNLRRAYPQIQCDVGTEKAATIILESELPTKLGGKGFRPTPFQYFFFGVAASYLSLFMILASQRGVRFDKVSLEISAELNYLKFFSEEESKKSVLEGVELKLNVAGDAPEEKLLRILEEAKERCPVFAPISVRITLNRI